MRFTKLFKTVIEVWSESPDPDVSDLSDLINGGDVYVDSSVCEKVLDSDEVPDDVAEHFDLIMPGDEVDPEEDDNEEV